jgi:hypothetical protein
MFETKLSSQQVITSKPESHPTSPDLDKGWYGPEALNEFQQVFEAIWSRLRRKVFPWDVHASRETLAILVFEHAKDAHGDFKHLKKQILQSLDKRTREWCAGPVRKEIAMDKIVQANIDRFSLLLETETDPIQRSMITCLLAEETNKQLQTTTARSQSSREVADPPKRPGY